MRKRTFLILIGAILLFIWGHSLVPLTSSSEESMSVMKILQGVLNILHIPLTLTEHIVRKLAHFAEHGAAGLLLGLYGYQNFDNNASLKKRLEMILKPLIVGFFIGFFDETIQIFSGRGAIIQDVWVDFFGVFCGAFLAFVILFLKRRKQRKAGTAEENLPQNE